MYDDVVVGAESTGRVTAERLSKDPEVGAALVEAGAPDTADEIQIPAPFGSTVKGRWDWEVDVQPEPELGTAGWPR